MSKVREEVAAYEERLRLAVLAPDPSGFVELVAESVVLIEPNGTTTFGRAKFAEAHNSGKGQVFSTVQMSNMRIVDHGDTGVVTCKGTYVTEGRTMTLKFMRVWVKKHGRWHIVAGSVSR